MRTLEEKLLVSQAESGQNRQIELGFACFAKKSGEIFKDAESETKDSYVAAVHGFTSMVGDKQKNSGFGKNSLCADGRISWSEMVTDREHQFSVGDFVWGKIGTHLYWPGRVYAPSDASDYAAKFKQGGHILVAFHDGKFSWCSPSLLEPFVEKFDLMSTQSNSRSFVNAVEGAVDEIGNLLELQLTCSCAPKRAKFRALTANSAIKKGVFVPLDGAGKLSIASNDPTLLVSDIRDLAQNASADGLLELTMLKSWLSAFYWAKGCYQLPVYQEPQTITELEGNNTNSLIDGGGHIEGPIQAQMDDLWVSLPAVPKYGQTDQLSSLSSVQQHLKVSEDELYQRRKQKSVAELMGEGVDIEPENMCPHMSAAGTLVGSNFTASTSEKIKERGEHGSQIDNQLISPLGRKRGRKPKLQGPAVGTKNQETYIKNGGLGSHSGGQLISPLGKKRGRKPKPKLQGPITTESQGVHVENGELGSNSSNQLSSPSGRKRGRKPKLQDPPMATENQGSFVENVELRNHSGIQLTSPLGRKRGRKPKIQVPITNENQYACIENGELGNHSGNQLTSSVGRKRGRKPKLQVSSVATEDQDSVLQHDGSKVIEGNYKSSLTIPKTVDREDKLETKSGLLSRRRKRSKYLSPPYTADVIEMLAHSSFNSDSETEYNEASNVDEDELQTRPGDPIMGFPPISGCGGKMCEINTINRLGDGHNLMEDPSSQPLKQEKVVIVDMKDVQASPREFLVELQYAAVSLQDLMSSEKLDMVTSFFALFRSSMYSDGSNYQLYHKPRRGRKRKSDLEPGSVGRKTLIQTLDHMHKSGGATNLQKKGEARLDVSKLKRAPVASDGKTVDDNDGMASSPALFVSFPPVFSMPTKENLIAMYNKFGALIEAETDILHNSFSARVVFARTGDAERAFNESVKNSPFGAAKVTFRLRYPSGFPMVQDVNGNSNKGAPSLSGEGNWPLESPSSIHLNFIEKKLKMMTAMLKSANGSLSQEMKCTLEGEMKGLLEKVSTMEVSTS